MGWLEQSGGGGGKHVLLLCGHRNRFELCTGKRVIFSATHNRRRLAGDALVDHLPDVFICEGTRLEELTATTA